MSPERWCGGPMPQAVPMISIGLPVFNGEDYLEDALTSLLTQSFADFELLICDNASTDGTESICRRFAAADPRIRYLRNERNLGAGPNYNKCFGLARGRYFRWAAHDDLCHPELLARCVEFLDDHPETVLVYPQTIIIDQKGRPTTRYDDCIDLTHQRPSDRLAALLRRRNQECNAIFGLVRSEVLRRTALIGSYPSSDQNLLAELALLGELRQIPETLFLRRDHPKTSLRAACSSRDVARWFDTSWRARIHLPLARRMFEYFSMAARIPLPLHERLRVLKVLAVMAYWLKRPLAREMCEAVAEALGMPVKSKAQITAPLPALLFIALLEYF